MNQGKKVQESDEASTADAASSQGSMLVVTCEGCDSRDTCMQNRQSQHRRVTLKVPQPSKKAKKRLTRTTIPMRRCVERSAYISMIIVCAHNYILSCDVCSGRSSNSSSRPRTSCSFLIANHITSTARASLTCAYSSSYIHTHSTLFACTDGQARVLVGACGQS